MKTNLKLFTNLIINKNIIVLKSYTTRQTLAFLQFQGDIEELEIIGLGVKKQYQNNGLGKKILNHLINKGYRKIFLEVSKTNKVALKLYYSLGFKKISIRKNYFSSKSNRSSLRGRRSCSSTASPCRISQTWRQR